MTWLSQIQDIFSCKVQLPVFGHDAIIHYVVSIRL